MNRSWMPCSAASTTRTESSPASRTRLATSRPRAKGQDVEALTAHLVHKVLIFGDIGAGTTSDPDAVPEPDLQRVALIDAYCPRAARVRQHGPASRWIAQSAAPGQFAGG